MTRKIRILILLCSLFPWLRAMADPIVTAVGSGSICPNDEIVIPVTVSNCNGVAAISLALNFDNTKVSYQGYQNLNSTVSTMLINASGGAVYLTWANMTNVNVGSGTLVELRFMGITGSTGLNWNTNLCEYSDSTGTVISSNYNNGSVSVYTVPSITSNPSNRNLVEGQSTTFEVGASGSGLSYQWQIKTPFDDDWHNLSNGGNHNNVNSWRLNVNNVTLDMNGNQYRCVVSGTCPLPVTSEAATLSVEPYIPPIPTIVTSTGSVSTCAEQAFSIPITVTNCNNVGAISLALNFNQSLVTYLGYENANTQLGNGTMRVNATNGTVYFTWASSNHTLEIGNGELISLVFKSASGNSSLSWNTSQCEYSNLSGEVLPSSFNGSNLNIYFPPSISSHPSNRTVTEGNNTNFSISASGQGLSYRWQMSQDQGISWENLSNGGHYSNVTSSTLYVNNVQMTMEGLRYRCVVNGTCEPPVTSNYGILHVVQPPAPTIVTTAGSLNTCSQTEFGIPISVTNCNNVGAISLALSYNTNVLIYAGYEGLNPALSGGQLQVNAANGTVFIAWASIAGANIGNGNLITINFTALSGTSSLSWNTAYCEYANPQGVALSASYNNGNVSVGDLSFTITQQPASQTVTMGENTTFSVATNGPTSGYQWQVSQNGGASWSNISAGGHYANPTTNTLIVNNVTLEMNGYRYRCVISGSCGVQYTSNAILTVQLPVNYHEIVLSADPAEGGTVNGGGAHEEGQPCTVTATPATGYDFVNWTENGIVVSTEASYTFTVIADRNLVAHFTLQELTIVTSVVPEGSGIIEGAGTYLYGEHVLLTAIPAEGFVFDNWTENGEVVSTNQSISFTAQTDRDLTANFSVMQLNITAIAVPANNGTVEGAGTYTYGTIVTLTAIAAEGFELANWTENDTVVSTETKLIFIVQTDRNFVANFIIQMLHITAECDPEGSGTITGAGTYNYGDPVVLTATPLSQFEFYNWTENGEEIFTQPTISFNAYNHRNLVAHFITTITIAATVQPEEGGTISGTGTYNFADPVTLTAQPNTGYAFVNWIESDTIVSTETSISFTAYVSRTFVVNFEMIMHHINVSANIDAGGSVSGGGDYQEGTYATVSAMPNTGFDFIRWTENGASVSTNANYMFVVWNPRDLMAEFEMQITDTMAFACDAFEWHGHTYTTNGIYYDTLSSYLGIDSIVALHLTIYPSYHYEYTETECGSYFWEDSLYTESGDYTREFQSMYGCDSIRTLHLTIIPIRPLGNFTYMSPANNYIDRYTDMDFYWDAIPNANLYDFYFWQGDGGRPDTPTLSNTTSHSYHVGGLTHGSTYNWCVVAKNECEEIESATRTFTCQLNPAMSVVPNGWYDFGEVEVGQTRTRTISVSGTALTEDISYDYLNDAWGQDAEFFTITPSNWNPTSGGLLHVTFAPEATQLYFNIGIRIASGVFVDTLYFTGSLANRYVFTTNVDGEVFSANDEITITGHVEDILGNPVSDMGVSVYLIVMGSRTNGTTVSDANGNYSTTYTPRYSESGFYQVGSCAYGTYSNEVHDSFDIPGMSRVSNDFIIWEPYQDETLTGTVEIRNRSRIPISNIQVNTISLPNGCSVNFTGVTNLGPLETGTLNYVVTGSQVTTGNNYEEATFQVAADNGLTMNMTCYYHCRERRGALVVYPPSIATTMKRYNQKVLSFQITNNGNGETGPITIGLPDVEWMSLLGNSTLESLPVGDSCAFSIMLAPDNNVSLVQYTGSIAVNCDNGNGISVPYVIEATSDSTGILMVDVTDDNTYNGNGDHLAGANVYVKGYYSLDMVAQGVTDENGLFIVENLPEGYYYLTIHATEHSNYEHAIILIEGGKTNHQNIYLQYQAISYSWVVVPTEIEDEYEFELVAEIHTNVPVPVVTVDCPSKIDTLAYGDTIQFNLTVTNHGLIDAYETQLTMPTEFPEYDFVPMIDFIDTLHAKSSVVIPCIVTRTQRRTGLNDYHCHLGRGRTISGYYCNQQKEWVEFTFTIGFRVYCNYTGPDNPIVNFPPPTTPSTPPVAPVLPPPSVTLGSGGSGWIGSGGWACPGGSAIPTSGVDNVTTTSQDCTPCWQMFDLPLNRIILSPEMQELMRQSHSRASVSRDLSCSGETDSIGTDWNLGTQTSDLSKIDPELQTLMRDSRDGNETFRVIVEMKEQYDNPNLERSTALMTRAEHRDYVVNELKRFSENSQAEVSSYLEAKAKRGDVNVLHHFWIFNGVCCEATASCIDELSMRNDVRYVSLDKEQKVIDPIEISNKRRNLPQRDDDVWHVSQVRADSVWNYPNTQGFTGRGVVVAILDSGVNYNHPDIKNNMWVWYYDENQNPVYGWDFYNNDNDPMDDNGHGSNVAGIAASNGAYHMGIAPDASIMALKVLDSISNWNGWSSVTSAVEFAVQHGADVLNLSIGDYVGGVELFRNTFVNVMNTGVVASVAGGNAGHELDLHPVPYNIGAPGNCPPPWHNPNQVSSSTGGASAVICVGNTDRDDNGNDIRYYTSSIGPVTWSMGSYIGHYNDYVFSPESPTNTGLVRPDVSAPGTNIWSLAHNYDGTDNEIFPYSCYTGTSQAAPCVAGVIALMLEANPNLTPERIDEILETTAVACEEQTSKNNYYGAGRVDAYAAVTAALNTRHVTVVANSPEGADSVSGGGFYYKGQPCTVTAIPKPGYWFYGWQNSGILVSSKSTYTFFVDSDINLTAIFVPYTFDPGEVLAPPTLQDVAEENALLQNILDAINNCMLCNRDASWEENLARQLGQCHNFYQAILNVYTNLFQEAEWMEEQNIAQFLDNFYAFVDPIDQTVSPQATQQLIDLSELTSANAATIQSFVERWNRSVQYWNEGIYTLADLPEGYNPNFVQKDGAMLQPAEAACEYATTNGFNNFTDMYYSTRSDCSDLFMEHQNDVCAKISVSFKQTMTMTREAFEGTLKIFNGHTTDPMQDINVAIVIKDADGVDRTDLFQVNVTSLSDITGVDGTGTLDAQTEGIAQFMMIPTIEAAPDTTKIYYFGGSFSFLDPFSGNEMTYDLFPVQLKVNPGPNLHVDYFISRHIISDDPLTDSIIESTEPAELAMMISNVGAGNANNVYLESSQPQIIDNQNGLLISFDMIGAAMNGEPRPLGLTDIPFGTIESHSAGIAEWYFTSTLMARIIHSTPHVVHNNSYGNPNLSLVTELNSHDLIKAIRAYGALEDGINDFFVNETVDFLHTPDKIYFSNGGTADVRKIIVVTTEGILSDTNNVVLLHVTPIAVGWNYAYLDDPAQGLREIVSCTRDDGQEIPLSNVWVSHVTMLDEGAPIHENKLHIVDTLAVNLMTTYTLVYGDVLEKDTVTQSTSLAQGWNWWSSYIAMNTENDFMKVKNALGTDGITIKSQYDGFVSYLSGDWYGNLNSINNNEMFMIQMETEHTLNVSGILVNGEDIPITINADGWSWIGYPMNTSQEINAALTDLTPTTNDILKARDDFSTYYPGLGWIGSLTSLTPGYGYMYQSQDTESKTFHYSNSRMRNVVTETPRNYHWETSVNQYAENATLIGWVSIDGIEQRSEQLEVGAFVGEHCVGHAHLRYVEPLDRYLLFLTYYGQGNDIVSFRIYDAESSYEYGPANEEIAFKANSMTGTLEQPYLISFGVLNVDEYEYGGIVMFPNPVRAKHNFKTYITNATDEVCSRVEIFNTLGMKVYTQTCDMSSMEIMAPAAAGIYIVRIISDDGRLFSGKLIVE